MRSVRRHTLVPLLAVLVALVLAGAAGCGGRDQPGAARQRVSPDELCTSLSRAELGKALDLHFTEVRPVGRGCLFQQGDRRALGIGLTLYDAAPGTGFSWYVDAAKRQVDGDDDMDLPDLGRGAFIATGTTVGGTVAGATAVLDLGDRVLQVLAVQATNDLDADALRTAARKVLELVVSRTSTSETQSG